MRYQIDENGSISKFVFDKGSVVAELDAEDRLKAAFARGFSLLSQRDSKEDIFYYINDVHGDVRHIADKAGKLVNSYSYDAFGNTIESAESIYNRFKYSGEQYDSITNQYYLRARFYNPVIGRFTQEDVYRGDGLNLYSYVANNPINYCDPSGYSASGKDECPRKSRSYDKEENKGNTPKLPNQGKVSGPIEGAPDIDAGAQGKHVVGHNNSKLVPDKSKWPPGEDGIEITQKAWQNGTIVKDTAGETVKTWDAGPPYGVIKVHMKKSTGLIHGYPQNDMSGGIK